jgi:hypothetical protein
MVASRLPRIVLVLALLIALGALGVSSTSCTNGTTPVCDDAGSCLIYAPPPDAAPAAEDAPAE